MMSEPRRSLRSAIMSEPGKSLSSASNNTVSSAALKLREALARAGLERQAKQDSWKAWKALDIGAAPGSWTKVLADYVGHVVACDPADLHADVLALPNVTHVQAMAERATDKLHELGPYHIVTCDANVSGTRVPGEIDDSREPLVGLLRGAVEFMAPGKKKKT